VTWQPKPVPAVVAMAEELRAFTGHYLKPMLDRATGSKRETELAE